MGITRRLIKWCDDKFEDAIHEENDVKGMAQAGVSGAVEGFMDAAITMYIPLFIMCCICACKSAKK